MLGFALFFAAATPLLSITQSLEVPAHGWSASRALQLGSTPLSIRVSFASQTPPAFPVFGVEFVSEAVGRKSEIAVELIPKFPPGTFTTRAAVERFKCVAHSPKKRVAKHDALATSRATLHWDGTSKSPQVGYAALSRVVDVQTSQVALQLRDGDHAVTVNLGLETPYELPPFLGEVLRQYRKRGPALVAFEKRGSFAVHRIATDHCGDQKVETLTFDASQTNTLGFPHHDWRMATLHGWVFVEPISAKRSGAIPSPRFGSLAIQNVTFLGDHYFRELTEVTTSPGRCTAVFELGDFSGCFGAGCGTPVNLRRAFVSFVGGKLSTQFKSCPPDGCLQ